MQNALLAQLIAEQQQSRRGQKRLSLGLILIVGTLLIPEFSSLDEWVRLLLIGLGLGLVLAG